MSTFEAKIRRFVPGTTVYDVMAEVELGKPWHKVLTTGDLAYAKETAKQFRHAGARVRIDRTLVREARRSRYRK